MVIAPLAPPRGEGLGVRGCLRDELTNMRFNIRDLLWATLVVCVALGWILDRIQMRSHMQSQLSAQLKAQKEALIIEFVKERNAEGLHQIFVHPDYPHPNDPNVGNGIIDLNSGEVPKFEVGPISAP